MSDAFLWKQPDKKKPWTAEDQAKRVRDFNEFVNKQMKRMREIQAESKRRGDHLLPGDSVLGKCVSSVASKAGLSEKTKGWALVILGRADVTRISAGKNPMGLAGAALFLGSVFEREDRTQKELAEAAGVSVTTIAKWYHYFLHPRQTSPATP